MPGGRRRGVASAAAGRWAATRSFLILAAAVLAAEVAGAAALAAAVGGPDGPAVLAALGNLCVALRFGITLRPGREPLITRYGRFDPAGLPDADGAYTRGLTAAWAALLGGFALAYAAAALGSWPAAAGALSAAQPLACAGLFLGEHALRNRRFPHHGRATPLRTLRAIRLSRGGGGGVRHAA